MEAGGSSLYRFGHGPQWTTRASNFGTTNTSRTSKPSSLVVHQNSCTLWHYDYVALQFYIQQLNSCGLERSQKLPVEMLDIISALQECRSAK